MPATSAARKKSATNYGMLPELVGYQLRMAQIALFRDFAQGPGGEDVTPGLFGVLVIIEANPDLKQSELARATQLDRSTVVTVIDNLAPIFQTVSRANPFFYVISGFRFGFLGQSDIGDTNMAVIHSALGLGVMNAALALITYLVLRSGWKLKS